ncbi:MAG: hypothetical protein Fur0037_14910 [Planctomycetota bacterium]
MARAGRWIAGFSMGLMLLWGCWLLGGDGRERPAADGIGPGTHPVAIAVEGLERRYLVHVPHAYTPARPWPVVIMFHGGGGTASQAIRETRWARKADEEGFLAVFPEGTAPDASRPSRFRDNPQTWNDGSQRSSVGAVARNVPDVRFVSRMIEDLKRRFRVDQDRVYVTGFSNGASMAFRVARELSPLIAAAAPVAGSDWTDKQPERPVPLLYMTGTSDPLNPIAGGEIRIGRKVFGEKPATREMIDRWVRMAGFTDEAKAVHAGNGVIRTSYARGGAPPDIVLYVLQGHGHHWPNGSSSLPESLAGPNLARIDATDIIWEFFKAHPIAHEAGERDAKPAGGSPSRRGDRR